MPILMLYAGTWHVERKILKAETAPDNRRVNMILEAGTDYEMMMVAGTFLDYLVTAVGVLLISIGSYQLFKAKKQKQPVSHSPD